MKKLIRFTMLLLAVIVSSVVIGQVMSTFLAVSDTVPVHKHKPIIEQAKKDSTCYYIHQIKQTQNDTDKKLDAILKALKK